MWRIVLIYNFENYNVWGKGCISVMNRGLGLLKNRCSEFGYNNRDYLKWSRKKREIEEF